MLAMLANIIKTGNTWENKSTFSTNWTREGASVMPEKDRLRTKKIHVFLSEAELQVAKEKADYSNLTLSGFVRSLIIDGAIIKYEPFAIEKICFEINKIGNNINQIAKKVNQSDSAVEADVDELRVQYEKLFELYISKVMGVE